MPSNAAYRDWAPMKSAAWGVLPMVAVIHRPIDPVVVAAVIVVAFRQVEGSLIQVAGVRARGAAEQLAPLLAETTSSASMSYDVPPRSTPPSAIFFSIPRLNGKEAARRQLATLSRSNPQIVDLWNSAGERVLTLATPPTVETMLPAGSMPRAGGFGALQVHGSTLFSETVTEIVGVCQSRMNPTRSGDWDSWSSDGPSPLRPPAMC